MYCPNCGSNVEDGAGFCGECGTKIEATVAQTPVSSESESGTAQSGKGGAPKWLIPLIAVVAVLVIGIVGVFAFRYFSADNDEPEQSLLNTTVENNFEEFTTVPEEITTEHGTTMASPETTVPSLKKPVSNDGGSKVVETKPETTKAPATVAPPTTAVQPTSPSYTPTVPQTDPPAEEEDWWYDDNYMYPSYGYTQSELEDALTDYINTNDWSELSEYILPGSYDILEIMIELEEEADYDEYAYFYGVESINRYFDNYFDIPYPDTIYYEYHDLLLEDVEYRLNTDWGLFEMAEYAFDEVYGGNMEFVSLSCIETFVLDDEGEDYGFFVFMIETDYGYFLLCI